MKSTPLITQKPGNTPIGGIPLDYFPNNCGFWLKLFKGFDKGKKLFFRDSSHGNGNPGSTIVFIHGNPECSYTYRKIIKSLINTAKKPFRIINVDHIGFGLSDQATYEMVCMDHCRNLFQLIKILDLKNVTLVVHDWGGPIGIGALLKEPYRLSSLIILNSTVFPLSKEGKTYKNYPISWLGWARGPHIIPNHFWGSFSSFAIFLKPLKPIKLLLNMLKYLLLAELNIFPCENLIFRKLVRLQFRSKLNTLSSKRLVLQTPYWGYGNTYKEPKLGKRSTKEFYHFIQQHIKKDWGSRGQNIGVKLVFGAWDAVCKKSVIKQWLENLPQLKGSIKVFKDETHFIQETKANYIADKIIEIADLK
ncbi:MAG: alpha/beta fold hydrolase [Candidatus Thorarchaeota archaeon]